MSKTTIIFSNKKCQCCGKLYPPKTEKKRCNCKQAGWLLETGTLHEPKILGCKVNKHKIIRNKLIGEN